MPLIILGKAVRASPGTRQKKLLNLRIPPTVTRLQSKAKQLRFVDVFPLLQH